MPTLPSAVIRFDRVQSFVTGFLSIWLVATANTLVRLRSEVRMRGRVLGVWTMALPGATPVTGLMSALAAQADARAGVGLVGLVLAVTATLTWRAPGPGPTPHRRR